MGYKLKRLSVLLVLFMIMQVVLPSISVMAAATAPGSLSYKFNNPSELVLTWTGVAGAVEYRVYDLAGGQKTLAARTTATLRTLKDVTQGTHVYAVSAMVGTTESELSTPVTVNVVYPQMPVPTMTPHSVLNVNDVTLKWNTVQYAQSYNLYQVVNGQPKLIANTSSPSRYLTNVPNGSTTYHVTSVHALYGESALSDPYVVEITFPSMQAPNGLSHSFNNGNDLVVRWDATQYATSYNIYQLVNGQRQFLTNYSATARSFPNMPEGTYTYEVTSVSDRFGESQVGSKITVNVVHPKMTAPANFVSNITNGNDVNLKWDVVNYTTNYRIYQVTNGERKLLGTTQSPFVTYSRQAEGSLSYEVTAFSERFGESPVSKLDVQVVYPKMKPPATAGYSVLNGNDITLRWDTSEFAVGYNVYKLIDGQRQLAFKTPANGRYLENMPAGDFAYVITSYSDRFGESELATPVNGTIVYPIMLPPTPVTGQVSNGNDLLLSWGYSKFADSYNVYKIEGEQKTLLFNYAGNARYFFKLPMGTYTYEVTAVSNRFGESPQGTRYTVDINVPEMKAPTVKLEMSGYNAAKLSWTAVQYAQKYNIYRVVNGTNQFVKSTTLLSDTLANLVKTESYEWFVTSVHDRYGESKPSNIVRPKFDVTPPETTTPETGAWSRVDKVIPLTGTDTESGVDQTYFSVNNQPFQVGNTVTIKDEGIHLLKFYSVDKAGNIEPTKSIEVKIDKTAPVATSNFAPGVTELVFSATDDRSGVDLIYYSINGGAPTEGSTLTVNQTISTVTFFAKDRAGNKSEETTLSFVRDEVAPVTSSNIPDAWQTGDVQVVLTATDDQSGVAKTYYSLNDGRNVEGNSFTITQEGITYVRFFSVDNAGNIELALEQEVKIDRSNPVTMTNLGQGWYNEDVDVKLLARDDHSGIAHSYYSLDGGEYVEGKSVLVTEEGTHTIAYYSVDKVGHVERASTMSFKIDKTAPITDHTTFKTAVGLRVDLVAKDDRSGIAKTFYSVNGSEYLEGDTFDLVDNGAVNIAYYSIDKAGNEEQVKRVVVKVDKVAPVTTSNIPQAWVNKDYNVVLTAEDDLSGVATTEYTLNGKSNSVSLVGDDQDNTVAFKVTEEGTHTVSYYSVDNAGNIEDLKTETLQLDKTAPVTRTNLQSGSFIPDVTYQLVAEDNLSGVAKTFYTINDEQMMGTSFTLSEPGNYHIVVYSIDQAGNKEEDQTFLITVDKVAPVTESDIQEGWTNEDVTVNLTATDDLSGVDQTYYAINGAPYATGTTFTLTDSAIHEVQYYSTDKAGNKEVAKLQRVLIDKNAPVTTSNVQEGWQTGQFEVVLKATDDLSGVRAVYHSVNGGEFEQGPVLTLKESGLYDISFYSVDNAGNKEVVKTVQVKVDNQAPVTVSDAPDTWATKAVTVNLTATDNLSGVDKTFYSVDGGAFQEGTVVTVAGAGLHVITFYSVDKAGNVEVRKQAEVKIDETAPVTTSGLQDGWYQEQELTVTLKATDDLSGVAKTYYSVNGQPFVEGVSFLLEGEGVHEVAWYSVDFAGNVEAVNQATVRMDAQPPVTTTNEVPAWSAAPITLQLTATDNLSGVDKTFVSVDGAEFQDATTVTVAGAGTHVVKYYSVDKAGNIEAVKQVLVNIDEVAPVTTSDVKDMWSQQDVVVNLTATDDLSGVETTFYSINGAPFAAGTTFHVQGEGVHTVAWYSVDKAGNVEATKSATVRIDKTAPTVQFGSDLLNEYVKGTSVKLSYQASDNLSGIKSVVTTVNGTTYASPATVRFDQVGTYNVSITVTDNAGWSTTITKTITVKYPTIAGTMKVTPNVIMPNTGIITVHVDTKNLPSTFLLSTVKVNGVSPLMDRGAEEKAKNGLFQFRRTDFTLIGPNMTFYFEGQMKNETIVQASDTVRVQMDKGKK